MKAGTLAANETGNKFLRRLAWIFFVGIVPILAACVMIGVALQVVGVPVWQTTTSFLGWSGKVGGSSPLDQLRQQLADAQAQSRSLQSQNAQLASQLQHEKQVNADLSAQVTRLQTQLAARSTLQAQAEKEASVLVGMDPSAAASVLDKLSIDEAAQVVAAMSASDSGPILAGLKPDKAAQILDLAGQLQALNQPGNGTANQTG